MQQLIRYEYGVYLQEKYLRAFYLFTIYYWENMRGKGIYLEDVNFQDLNKESKKQFIYNAFILWTTYQTETWGTV